MDQGRIVESGPPLNLYEDTASLFRRLCDTKVFPSFVLMEGSPADQMYQRIGIRDILKIRDDASDAVLRTRRASKPRTREVPGRLHQRQPLTSAYLDVPTVFARFF